MNIESFFRNLLNGKKSVDTKTLNSIYSKPQPDKGDDATKFSYITAGYKQQADLLYLTNDSGYLYALVVVDQGSRQLDAVALKTRDAVPYFKYHLLIFLQYLYQFLFVTVYS